MFSFLGRIAEYCCRMPESRITNTPFALIIRDGWGHNPYIHHRAFNAVELARTPASDLLMANFPTTLIHTSGEDVGLPEGTTGNSEVGHQNIGAGRIVFQEHMRISRSIANGRFFSNEPLCAAVQRARTNDKAVHFMGIASDAGVHGVLYHLNACLELCKRLGHKKVFVHFFTDGRDTGPFTGIGYVAEAERFMRELGIGKVVSVLGRFWAMDRDNRWERIERAYRCLTGRGATIVKEPLDPKAHAVGADGKTPVWVELAESAADAINQYYQTPVNDSMQGDEFITPTMIGPTIEEAMETRINDGDVAVCYNYRGDRPREIIRAFKLDPFEGEVPPSPDSGMKGFKRGTPPDIEFVTMTEYDKTLTPYVSVMFPRPEPMPDIAGDLFSRLGLRQVRAAETEKYPHVTFFFNDYREQPFEGEIRLMVQSPKVSTYDLQPEMSARDLTEKILARLTAKDREDVFIINFANPDMVGHTGNLDAAIKAVETTDKCVGKIVNTILELQGCAIVTADHGNSEQMYDPVLDAPHTSHTLYDVPLILIGENFKGRQLRHDGRLADIIPTALEILGIPQPKAMTGQTLLMPGKSSEKK